MLTIKHLTGPLAGTDTPIEQGCTRVVFGRQMGCEVTFPPETKLVSGRHFALVRKDSGDWTIDLFGGPFVAIDGRSAEQGQPIRTGSKLELGRQGGPSFETLVTSDTRLHNYEATEKQQAFEGPRSIAEAAGTRARIAVFATLVVAVAAAAYGVVQHFSGQTSAARLDEAIAQFTSAHQQAAEISIAPALRSKLIGSVYLVFAQNKETGGQSGVGTAWPVGPHLLGTNAHVAEEATKLPRGVVMKVRSAGDNGKVLEVTRVRVHPGFEAMARFYRKDPIGLKNAAGGLVAADLRVPAYDVALLEVKEEVPKEHIFELATSAQLAALHAGQPIATAGYPGENIVGSNSSLVRATPEFHLGAITGLTNFFFLPADDRHRQLIHDDLPIAGGASGSPVIDNTGRVIGLQSAGNMNFIDVKGQPFRMPSAALINYAQRVDMLRDLLDGNQDKVVAQDEAYWNQQAGYFKRGIDLLIPKILDGAKQTPSSVVTTSFDQTLKLTEADKQPKQSGGIQRQKIVKLSLTRGYYVFVAYGYEVAPLELYLMVGKKIIDYGKGNWYPSIKYRTDPSVGDANLEAWFPSLKVPDGTKTDVELWVVSPEDKDVSFALRAYRIDPKQPSG